MYELVVRDDYWTMQSDILCKMSGLNIDIDFLNKIHVAIISAAEKAGAYIRQLIEAFSKVFENIAESFRDIVCDIAESFDRFADCFIVLKDCEYSAGTKRSGHRIHRKQAAFKATTSQELYYKKCFEIKKRNYEIMNHDRRF